MYSNYDDSTLIRLPDPSYHKENSFALWWFSEHHTCGNDVNDGLHISFVIFRLFFFFFTITSLSFILICFFSFSLSSYFANFCSCPRFLSLYVYLPSSFSRCLPPPFSYFFLYLPSISFHFFFYFHISQHPVLFLPLLFSNSFFLSYIFIFFCFSYILLSPLFSSFCLPSSTLCFSLPSHYFSALPPWVCLIFWPAQLCIPCLIKFNFWERSSYKILASTKSIFYGNKAYLHVHNINKVDIGILHDEWLWKKWIPTPWNAVFLQKRTVTRLIKKFAPFHGHRTFIAVFTIRYLSLSQATSNIEFAHFKTNSLISILILLPLLQLAPKPSKWSFFSGFLTEKFCGFLIYSRHATCSAHKTGINEKEKDEFNARVPHGYVI